ASPRADVEHTVTRTDPGDLDEARAEQREEVDPDLVVGRRRPVEDRCGSCLGGIPLCRIPVGCAALGSIAGRCVTRPRVAHPPMLGPRRTSTTWPLAVTPAPGPSAADAPAL